ncbi:hypothetical protein EDB87DRAFT_1685336 [Lactarius vividus]|nr:hypothetical protein EDB87DRAFT_1685336 [Lactarius vividus]
MGTPHRPHNQPPSSGGYHYDTPTLPAPAGQMLKPSYPTRTHHSAPPTRPYHPPPPRQHSPPSAHAHSASHRQQLDAGVFPPPSSGCYGLPPRPQNAPRLPSAPEFAYRQRVKARITADGWVIGIIVSALHVCSKVIAMLPLDATRKNLANLSSLLA